MGLKPRREATRPLLPQHARHCPVLEAGSALGFMVYAPLEPKESLYIEHEGEGRYRFVYYLQTQDGKRTPIFQVTMSLSVGGVGMVKEEVTFVGAPMLSREAALAVMRVFLVPEDMGTPPGAIALRGATNFQHPHGRTGHVDGIDAAACVVSGRLARVARTDDSPGAAGRSPCHARHPALREVDRERLHRCEVVDHEALHPSLQAFETWLLFVDRQYRWIYCVALMHIRAVLPNDHPDGRSTRSRAHEVNVVS